MRLVPLNRYTSGQDGKKSAKLVSYTPLGPLLLSALKPSVCASKRALLHFTKDKRIHSLRCNRQLARPQRSWLKTSHS